MRKSYVTKMMILSILTIIFTTGSLLAEDVEDEFMHEGFSRNYILHIPPQYDGSDSLPLVIALHGGGKNREWIRDASDLSIKADEEGFFVCYPNGTQSGDPGENNWNAGPNFGVYADDVSFIAALIDKLATDYMIDTLRVYVTGLSAGAMMTHRLALELSDKIAAAAPVAGALMINWDESDPTRPISLIGFHARDDSGVPYYGATWVDAADTTWKRWSEKLACDIGPDTFYNDSNALRQTWTREDDSCEVVFWTTEDGGHSWPGGNPYDQDADIPSDDISANDLMWEFFMAHPIPIEEEPEPGIEEHGCGFDTQSPFLATNAARISFFIDNPQQVKLSLFDVSGREISVIVDERVSSGRHEVSLDVGEFSRGVYFYRLLTPASTSTRSVILIR